VEAEIVALENYVRDLRTRLSNREDGLRLARDAIALQLCLALYRLITTQAN
jgi:hypothetical protein